MERKRLSSFSNLSKFLLIIAIVFRLCYLLFVNLPLYQTPFDSQAAKDKYFQSSYIRGDKSDITLSDSELYAIEGYFLNNEKYDLEKLTPGHPPLGKYLIGWSIEVFRSPYVVSYITYCLVLLAFYLFSKSLLLTLVISFEPLLLSQLNNSLLDLFLLLFQLISIIFFQQFINSKKHKILYISVSNLFIGLSFATKFFPVTMPLLGAYFLFILFSGKFDLFKKFILSLLFIPIGYVLGHFSYFVYHPSIVQFAKYFRYVLNWWAGSPHVPPFAVWSIIFQNQWPTWWGQGIITVPDWWIGWPIVFSIALLLVSRRRLFLWAYLVISFCFLSFQAIFPRHLTLILPIAYFLAYDRLKELIQGIICRVWPPA